MLDVGLSIERRPTILCCQAAWYSWFLVFLLLALVLYYAVCSLGRFGSLWRASYDTHFILSPRGQLPVRINDVLVRNIINKMGTNSTRAGED